MENLANNNQTQIFNYGLQEILKILHIIMKQ